MPDNRARTAVFGASGRLGKEIAELMIRDARFVAGPWIAHPKSRFIGQTLFNQVVISTKDSHEADLYIDASIAQGFEERLEIALRRKKPIAIGTTGLNASQKALLSEASRTIPLLYTPNFSLGMALLKTLAQDVARKFYPDAAIDLIEMHHAQKKDAPSGSALLLSDAIRNEGHREIAIHSIRSGTIPGTHEILFNTPEESIRLIHSAYSRAAFAKGALQAAHFLLSQPPGLYTSWI